jgi:hypothetical protein
MTPHQSRNSRGRHCDGPVGSIPWFSVTGATATICWQPVVSAVFQLGFVALLFHRLSIGQPRSPRTASRPDGAEKIRQPALVKARRRAGAMVGSSWLWSHPFFISISPDKSRSARRRLHAALADEGRGIGRRHELDQRLRGAGPASTPPARRRRNRRRWGAVPKSDIL